MPDLSLSRRGLLRAAVGGAAATSLAACGTGASASGSAAKGVAGQLRIGFQPPYIVMDVLQKQKTLASALSGDGTDVSLKVLDPTIIQQSVAGRALDLGLGGLGPIQLSSQPFTVVALVEHSPRTQALLVRKDSDIKSVTDLKGKKLGSYGTTINANLFVLRAAEKAGIDADDIKFVPLTTDQITAALLSGSVDAVQTWDPFAAQLEATKRTRTLLTGQGLVENYVVIYGHRDYVKKYPKTIAKALRTYRKALTWVNAHQDDALRLFASANRLDAEVAALTFRRREYLLSAPNERFLADLKRQERELKASGVLTKSVDWEAAIDHTIAAKALTADG
ncbi:putative sulfonate ABC transporter, sulfonate-binding protein [Streptomyces bingchenggensis BCW-1]|uniref:Putative aliphatic sulfonates-binding protein n=1 Tax=Streptomyces bingchenggensis (strain BCW-1) TaxID=749414 RepID=D7C7N2_STRBB|nr:MULTISPECIES: ABC transporter substrate-binding protein [Streptomyces]ADI12580.1 putative sulfonate ABC transporter, sulfonate-binding protein [Streptomyces bingchenggensis BCW-1]